MLLTNNIIILIRKYKRISIFFHEYPDGDALGSAYGLQKYLQNLFPNKTIKIVGTDLLKESEKFDIFDSQETVSKTFISQSLGIILDTANSARVFTQQHILCDDVVLIDHHPQQEKYCSIELIDPSYSSTCEMIYELIKQTDPNHFDEVIAKYLYIGIMTDTGWLKFPNASTKTFGVVQKLVSTGFNRSEVVNKLNSISFQQKKYESVIIKNIKIDWTNQIAWAIIPKNSYLKFGLDKPSSMIYLLQNLKGIKMCSTIYYCPIANEWKGSLRSKEKDISIVAKKYNGGGHKLASGFKIKNKNEFKNVIKDLKNL